MEDESIRINEISDCRQRAIICKKPNLSSSQIFKSICNTVINYPHLTKYEKKYLINDIIRIRDAQNVIENTGERRKCEYCNNQVIAITYCESCIRDYLKSDFSKWTAGSVKIDKLIQECQINSVSPSDIFEWIPFENFTNLEFREEGDFSLIYVATWRNGPFTEWDTEKQELKRNGGGSFVLKNLKNSRTIDEKWLKNVIENLTAEKFSQSLIKCYGLTKNPDTQDFMIVLQYMDSNLRDFLAKTTELSWKTKFKMVRNISNSIRKIHNQNIIHKNLHSRNILVDEAKPHFVVSDFGLYKPLEKSNEIYGNLPYIAPEILYDNSYTMKSDIYSLGMIMWEISSGVPPFYDQMKKIDNELALNIINGSRPKVIDEIPSDYADLMIKCWDSNPENRPNVITIMKKMENLLREIYENDGINEELKLIPIKVSKTKRLIRWFKMKFKIQKNKNIPSTNKTKETFTTDKKNKNLPLVEKDKGAFLISEQDKSQILIAMQNKSRIYQFENLPVPVNVTQE